MTRDGRKRIDGARRALILRTLALFAALALAVVMVGCYNNNTGEANIGGEINITLPAFPETGGNSIQMFTEMHYQPSYRSQEGPRLLPPEDSVPVTGREVRYTSLEEYQELVMPDMDYDAAEAEKLYSINCVVCHGQSLTGDGPLTPFITRGPVPADLTGEEAQSATDGEIFGFITGGGRQGLSARLRDRDSTSPMPEFRLLLTEDERWTLVQYLRSR